MSSSAWKRQSAGTIDGCACGRYHRGARRRGLRALSVAGAQQASREISRGAGRNPRLDGRRSTARDRVRSPDGQAVRRRLCVAQGHLYRTGIDGAPYRARGGAGSGRVSRPGLSRATAHVRRARCASGIRCRVLQRMRSLPRGRLPDVRRRYHGASRAILLRLWERAGLIGGDVRYAIRRLLSSPGCTIAATLTMAIAIGATASVFGLVDGVLLKAFPYRDANRVLTIWEGNPAMRVP